MHYLDHSIILLRWVMGLFLLFQRNEHKQTGLKVVEEDLDREMEEIIHEKSEDMLASYSKTNNFVFRKMM